jgi:hypothetical protein
MPTVNVYHKRKDFTMLDAVVPKLKVFLADKLTCDDIKLRADEVSVRLITVHGRGMLGNVELDITAHGFPERVQKQDKVCYDTKAWVENETSITDVRVWLRLCQLGHDIVP